MLLATDRLSFAYTSFRPVLREVSAAIPSAAITVVIGPNGAGKSTLLRLLLGSLTPTSGAARLDGEDIHRLPARRRAARIAYIPQSASLSEAFTVEQVVRLGRYARPTDPGAVSSALDRLELSDLADQPFGILSAGQQQRVTLARALAQLAGPDAAPQSQVILADEPCAAMDPRHALQAMSILRSEAARGVTVVIVLHDFTAALRFADHALVLDDTGRLAAAGPADHALDPDRLGRVFGIAFDRLGDGAGRAHGSAAALVPRLTPADTIPRS